MSLLLEIVLRQGFLLDLLGVLGIGLVAAAGVRLTQRHGLADTRFMAFGAIALLAGRVLVLVYSELMTPAWRVALGDPLFAVVRELPTVLLTLGLGAIVMGFWGHERRAAEMAGAEG